MHIANVTSTSLNDQIEPVDLGQTPADVLVLSFSDSDLGAIKRAYELAQAEKTMGAQELTMRLAALKDLRHPMSVDLWLERTATSAKVIVVRVLGGYEWWSYGCDRLAAVARAQNIKLALLPGESHDHDDRLAALSTMSQDDQDELLALFREGGVGAMTVLIDRLAALAGHEPIYSNEGVSQVAQAPQWGFYAPGRGVVPIAHFTERIAISRQPVVPILFYRAMLLAGECAPVEALAAKLARRGMLAVPIFVPTLKDAAVQDFLLDSARALSPAVIVTTTAFAAAIGTAQSDLFSRIGAPVVQAIIATTGREAWAAGARGLGTSDIAMHVVLPELDGRVLAGALSFKTFEHPVAGDCAGGSGSLTPPGPLQFNALVNQPEPDRVDMVARRIGALVTLQRTCRSERRLVIIMPDYPGADGRTGYAVGLDVPASILAMLQDLAAAGYRVSDVPKTSRELLALLARPQPALAKARWQKAFDELPPAAADRVRAAWGEPEDGPGGGGYYAFRFAQFGNVTVVLAPDRGRAGERRADYHDPDLPPRHELLAFGHWLREELDCHALVHCGAHGTLEWLPGKAVALSAGCFPEIVTGALPVIYPFIVNNPGEAAQAKRRIGAVTIGHMPPPMSGAGLSEAQQELEQLVDEYVQADGLDAGRQKRLADLIVEKAAASRLDRAAGVTPGDDADEALKRIDTWLCDLKDFAIKDGQHIFGRCEKDCAEERRRDSARSERHNLLAALDGRFVPPGPAGSPARGRADVYPTGRNLYTIDPRMMPSPTAFEIGKKAADEVLRLYLQEHGEWPRALVIDLWASASLRTGGEEIAQGFALMGCRPQWDASSARVTGVEVLSPASIGRPRIDVTWRLSGLFRDMFPAQIALMSAAVEAVARRQGEGDDNPLAQDFQAGGRVPQRVFGSAPGNYGSGIEGLLQDGRWVERKELGAAYLAGGAYAYGGAEGTGRHAPALFAERVSRADLLVHVSDDSGHDLLEGSADVAHIGGFAAARAALGLKAHVQVLDSSNSEAIRARPLGAALARVVHARAVNPRYIRGQMRHGPRGASDFAETVDRLIGFAETTDDVGSDLIDALFDAYVVDDEVRAFVLRENPPAARFIGERLEQALARALWHPRRNSAGAQLRDLIESAQRAHEAAGNQGGRAIAEGRSA